MIEERNAVIEDARITNEDHGVLSAWVSLDYGGAGQGFGGYCLYNPNFPDGVNACGHFIWRVLEIVGVSDWAKLKGKTIRVRADHGKVHAIGHIIKDLWFFPSEEFVKLDKWVKP